MSEKWKPTEEQRRVLQGLLDEAQREESVSAFCKHYAPFTEGKFHKIMDALDDKRPKSYFDEIKRPEALMEELTEWFRKLPALRLEREAATASAVIPITKFRAVAVAIRQCKNVTSPERIIKYIAPTGGSKTTLRRYLESELRSEMAFHAVESRETWRPATRDQRQRAKLTVVRDFCAALGMRNVDFSKGIANVEDEIVAFCSALKRVLFIDEAEFFSAYTLNLIKLLTNKTRLIVVIACTPRAHAKWNSWYADEADQISRRTHAVIAISEDDLAPDNIATTVKDVAKFFPENQFENADAALKYIAQQAWLFGHYSTVARIADILQKSVRAERGEVEKAVNQALKQMAKERVRRA